jgi:glyoxylase-like metal-dependent hydrolase (beta-lactamase superfamily II)
VGKEGTLLIDPGFKETVPQLKRVLSQLGSGQIRYIINTHHHGDHVQGNTIRGPETVVLGLCEDLENLTGQGILLSGKSPLMGKKKSSFEHYYTLNFSGQTIRLIPSPGAHSRCDWIIHFTEGNVVHMGDLLLSQSFPAVGRNVQAYMSVLGKAIDFFPEQSVFVSGHGKDLTKQGVRKYRKMLKVSIERILKARAKGLNAEEMKQSRILKEFESYNHFLDWLTTDYWIDAVVKGWK